MQRSILLTVLYADVFDFALTEDELYRRLIGRPVERERFRLALGALEGVYLTREAGYLVWAGREALIGLRRRRLAAAPGHWAAARRYARWLRRVPFVRMVAVSGSLAAGNAAEESDVDVFCVVETNRLWVARLCIVPLSRLTRALPRLFPRYLCPNYVLAEGALAVEPRDLFTAHEVVQAVPVWGKGVHRAFLQANPWVYSFLPHAARAARGEPARAEQPAAPRLTRWCERLLGGHRGDRLDAWLHRAFVAFYRTRAERSGWAWAGIAAAYERNRYTVPEGGYARVVPRLFAARVHRYLDGAAELERLFPPLRTASPACYDWEKRFNEEYGAGPAAGKPK